MAREFRTGLAAAAIVMLLGASPLLAQAPQKELSEKSVTTIMNYAWTVLPSKFTMPSGKVVEVDKTKRDALVPVETGREVIKVGYNSAQAQLCEMWEEQARFGLSNGICLALHMPEGRHFILGVERDRPVPMESQELTRLVADLQLFAVHAQDVALRILTPVAAEPGAPPLTPRELETLRWTMEGKTAWEVGNVLGITERTAALHVNNATHKLGCVNKYQAVLKALRLGIIG